MGDHDELEQEVLREFLVESAENLSRMDQEMVELESRPGAVELLSSIFRTIHTIKGNSGFFALHRLEAIAHIAESLLGELRSGQRTLNADLTSLILESMDAIRRILASVQAGQGEGEVFETALLARLQSTWERREAAPVAATEPVAIASDIPTPLASEPLTETAATPLDAASDAPPLAAEGEALSGWPVPVVAQPEAPATASLVEKAEAAAATSVRLNVEVLDRIMNLVGELVLARNQLLQFRDSRMDEEQDESPLTQISQRFDLITSELQSEVMKTRMQPVSIAWSKLPRLVRDLATQLKKQIVLEMEGADTELDRTIIEAIKDPLTHIVRNSCDHGIGKPERRVKLGKPAQGTIKLRAYHEGGKVKIEISDDGKGIDPKRVREKAVERGLVSRERALQMTDAEAARLVFLPGFSTATKVTNVSGRGVGMDVVKTNVERVGGSIDLTNNHPLGTNIKLEIPLTVAILPGLIVSSGGQRFVIPQVSIRELIWLDSESMQKQLEFVHEAPVLRRRDGLLPLVDFNQLRGLKAERTGEELSVVMLRADGKEFGLIVDSIADTEEIVVKPLGPIFRDLECYAGATIMGDGGIALILDVAGLGKRAGVLRHDRGATAAAATEATQAAEENRASILLFRAGRFARVALRLAQVSRLEQIPMEKVEYASGHMVVQYGAEILPLVPVAEALGEAARGGEVEVLEVIVCRTSQGSVGLVVDEVLDAVDEVVGSLRSTGRQGLLGSALLGGQVTDVLDLDAVVAYGAPSGAPDALDRLALAMSAQMETWQ